jgi:hypothetical protein
MDQSESRILETDDKSRAFRAELLKVGLEALSHRLLTLVAIVLNAGAAAWCMLSPDALRVVTGLLFAVTCWTLINVQRKG